MEHPSGRAPNIRDVAHLAGVSHQTVSRVLNDSPSIRDSTRDRVRDAIESLGYRPNPAARALVTSRSGTIGVLSSQSTHYGPSASVTAVEVAAREAGYRTSVTSILSGEATIRSGLNYLLSQSVEAIVVLAPQVGVFEAIQELAISVPLVTLESSGRHPGSSLSVDQEAGARLAVRHLIELGHERIAHLAGPADWIEAHARERGYRAELAAAGLAPQPAHHGDWTADSGFAAARGLLADDAVTAAFVANDQMALGLLHGCRDLGRAVPEGLSIVGFDDVPEAAHYLPPLTTVRQNFAELGRRAVSALTAQLRGEPAAQWDAIEPVLVIRQSTAAPRS